MKWLAALQQLLTTSEAGAVARKQARLVREVLECERRVCQDDEYARQLALLLGGAGADMKGQRQDRPLAAEVEVALLAACRLWPQARPVWLVPLHRLAEARQQPGSPDQLLADLHDPDWRQRFVARHSLAALGGEAVPGLARLAAGKSSPLWPTAAWLLRNIEVDTTARLSSHRAGLVCPRCLVRCHAHLVHPAGLEPSVYYGCRACGQSREFRRGARIIAVLDAGWHEADGEQENLLRGNWLVRRRLFDFDGVEIIRATDEDVERFAVQVGNDTDPTRKPRYAAMVCRIGPECRLSENTRRILARLFGQVEQEQA